MAAVLKMQEFSYGGTIARGSRVSVPSGVQGQSPDGGFAVSTPESETVCRHRLQMFTAETVKISPPVHHLLLTSLFHGTHLQAKRHFAGGLASKPMPGTTAECRTSFRPPGPHILLFLPFKD